jgi:GT2 family glycosyltransferase
MASGDILAWLNDDDLWLPGSARRVLAAFRERPEADVIYGACVGIDLAGQPCWYGPARPFSLWRALVEVDHVINQPAAFMRRSVVEAAGGLRQSWIHDHDLWIRAALAGATFVAIPHVLAATRIHPGNRSQEPKLAVAERLALVDYWMADPRVPARIRARKRLARSNAYMRGFHHLHPASPRDWLLGLRWLGAAVMASPANAPVALARPAQLAMARLRRPHELQRLKDLGLAP